MCVAGGADLQALDPRDQLAEQSVGGLLADRHRHRNRHAAFAGRAVAGADQRVDRLVHVGVGHDNHVVLGAAEALHALAVGAAGRIDVFGDGRRADEADGLDTVVGEQRVDGFLVAVDHVEHALRQARFEEQFGDPHRHRWIAFRRLQDEGIAAGDRRRTFPQRDHRREIKRRDAGDDAERLPHRIKVDAGAGAFGVFALQQVRNSAGELYYLEPALDVAARVGQGLAVLGGQELGEAVVFLLHQLEKLEHHTGAPLRIGCRPGRLRGLRIGDGMLDLGMLGQRHFGLHLAGVGIEDVAEASGGPFYRLAADEVADLAHVVFLQQFLTGPGARTLWLWRPFAAIFAAFCRPVTGWTR